MTMIQSHATDVAGLLGELRRAAGLSLRDIAPRVGVSYATAGKWENGKGEPSVTEFIRWAQATNQPVENLLDGLIEMACARRDSNSQPSDP